MDRSDYEAAKLPNYKLNRWYWIYTARSQSRTSLRHQQKLGIYDSQLAKFVVSFEDDWESLPPLPSLTASSYLVYINGFQGRALGFCGKLRRIAVMKGAALSFKSAYQYLTQQQGGSSIADLITVASFNLTMEPLVIDETVNNFDDANNFNSTYSTKKQVISISFHRINPHSNRIAAKIHVR